MNRKDAATSRSPTRKKRSPHYNYSCLIAIYSIVNAKLLCMLVNASRHSCYDFGVKSNGLNEIDVITVDGIRRSANNSYHDQLYKIPIRQIDSR